MTAKKAPVEEQALRRLKEGFGDKEVAAKVGKTANHVWAIRVH